MFIEKMAQLRSSELRLARRREEALHRMRTSIFQTMTPMKVILAEYSKMTTRGFDCYLLAKSLRIVNDTISARGNSPKLWSDYSIYEMDTSWRFEKVFQDVKFGLAGPNGNDPSFAYFSAPHMAEVSRQLGELGYKNTELVPLWFAKIDALIADEYVHQGVSFGQAVYGGMKGFVPRHYIYRGFEDSMEFKEHMQTLIDWNTQSGSQKPTASRGAGADEQPTYLDVDPEQAVKTKVEQVWAAHGKGPEDALSRKQAKEAVEGWCRDLKMSGPVKDRSVQSIWKQIDKQRAGVPSPRLEEYLKQASADHEVIEVQEAMEQLMAAADQMKTVQIDQQAAIDNVRAQYFKLQNASSKHDFLQEN